MNKPFYLYKGWGRWTPMFPGFGYCWFYITIRKPAYKIAINPTLIKNCDCDAPKKRLKYHRKTCTSYHNQVLYYTLSPAQRIKSMFLPAEKIFNFYAPPVSNVGGAGNE